MVSGAFTIPLLRNGLHNSVVMYCCGLYIATAAVYKVIAQQRVYTSQYINIISTIISCLFNNTFWSS
jgi:hypothetical protein